MRIDTLAFLHVLLCTHQPEVFHPHIQSLLPPVVACIGDPFYKITSEALLVAQQLVKVLRPLDKPCTFDAKPYVRDLFPATLKRLQAADMDQEVKERAISCMAQTICHLGDHLSAHLQPTLRIFLERLRNEITRLAAVKALTLVAGSPLKIDLRPVLGEGFPILASFLRQSQRALRLSALTALDVLVGSYSDCLQPAMVGAVLAELPALITDSDMHVSQLAILFLTTLAKVYPSCLSKVSGPILAAVLQLVHSPLLQGAALGAIAGFLQALVAARPAAVGCAALMRQLTEPIYCCGAAAHKQTYRSVARCVAALCSACPEEAPGAVSRFLRDARSPGSSSAVRVLALLCLAELGRGASLGAQGELQAVILEAFGSPSEEEKSAASYALGSIGVGSLQQFLPFLLQEIGSQPRRQYLLLTSLRELLGSCPPAALAPYVEDVWALLFRHCECAEEGTRSVVAECLGRLTLVNPAQLLPRLREQLASGEGQGGRAERKMRGRCKGPAEGCRYARGQKGVGAGLNKEAVKTPALVQDMLSRAGAVLLPGDLSLSCHPAGSPHARGTVVTAVKFTIADQPQPIDALLKGCIGTSSRAEDSSGISTPMGGLPSWLSPVPLWGLSSTTVGQVPAECSHTLFLDMFCGCQFRERKP